MGSSGMIPTLATMFGANESTTYLGLPELALDDIDGVDVVIIGAPCATPYVSVGPYCANAPAAIRVASRTFSASRTHMNFDLGGPAVPSPAICVDAGDLAWGDDDFASNRTSITDAVTTVLRAGAVPIVLGGDDSIPIPVIAAYGSHNNGPIGLVQIDAHIDWRDEVNGERLGLSSTMRRCSEMAHVGTMVQIGRRGVGSARPADLEAAQARNVGFVGARDVHRHGVDAIALPSEERVFITIDVDGLDPSIMPGVIGPEPGGLTYTQAIDIIDAIATRSSIAGVSIVEFVPERDVNGLGALTAFRLSAHALGRICEQRLRDTAARRAT